MFLMFLIIETIAMISGLSVAIYRMRQLSQKMIWQGADGVVWVVAFILLDGIVLLGVTALMLTQVIISSNITPLFKTTPHLYCRYSHDKTIPTTFLQYGLPHFTKRFHDTRYECA